MCRRFFPLIVPSLFPSLFLFLSLSFSHPSLFSLPHSTSHTLSLSLSLLTLLSTSRLPPAAHTARRISNAPRRRHQHVRQVPSYRRARPTSHCHHQYRRTRRPHHSPPLLSTPLPCSFLFDRHCRAAVL